VLDFPLQTLSKLASLVSSGYKDVFMSLDISRQYTISGLTQISQTSFHPQRWVCIPRHSITLISRSKANSVPFMSILKTNSDSLISTQITSCRTCPVHSAHCDIGHQHRSCCDQAWSCSKQLSEYVHPVSTDPLARRFGNAEIFIAKLTGSHVFTLMRIVELCT